MWFLNETLSNSGNVRVTNFQVFYINRFSSSFLLFTPRILENGQGFLNGTMHFDL